VGDIGWDLCRDRLEALALLVDFGMLILILMPLLSLSVSRSRFVVSICMVSILMVLFWALCALSGRV